MIAVLDYGMGNLRSVQKALEHVGAEVEVTYDADRIRAAAGLVLPGVGAFPKAMQAVHERGLDELIHQRSDAGVPILGICLGMQLLFDSSVELGGADGLGLLEGEVRALDAPGLKIPQIGWNEVEWMRESAINAALPGDRTAFYHVHSFAPVAGNGVVLGRADYGSSFVSAVAGDGIFGVQFHPEKSGPDGLTLLSGFAALTA